MLIVRNLVKVFLKIYLMVPFVYLKSMDFFFFFFFFLLLGVWDLSIQNKILQNVESVHLVQFPRDNLRYRELGVMFMFENFHSFWR